MKRFKNKEFQLLVQNLLCAEEHTVDMMLSAKKEKEQLDLTNMLSVIKLERNLLLNFPEEKDRNKWCLLKHMLLANYHSLEMINSEYATDDIVDFYKKSNTLIQSILDKEFDVKCNVCENDLFLFKFLKKGDKE